MDEPIRAKVLDTDYDESRRLIKWLIKDLDKDSEFTIAWLDEDLSKQFSFTHQLPPELIRSFCEQMKNKEFNLVMHATAAQHDSDWFKDEDKVQEINEKIEQYPYREVLEQIEERSMKVRLFGIEDCPKCEKQKKELEKGNIPYFYIDADSDENQDFCDEQEVDEVPHIQVVFDGEVIMDHIGFCKSSKIKKLAEDMGDKIV